jgi:anthranilate synthase component 2
VVDRASVPDVLAITAETADGLVMGLRHVTRPIAGVQFHPESILTVEGTRLLANFVEGRA